MSRITALLLAIAVAPHAVLAAPKEMTVFQLLAELSTAVNTNTMSQKADEFLRSVISEEISSASPIFCPKEGQGAVAPQDLQQYLLNKAPDTSQQKSMQARPAVLHYLAQTFPCK